MIALIYAPEGSESWHPDKWRHRSFQRETPNLRSETLVQFWDVLSSVRRPRYIFYLLRLPWMRKYHLHSLLPPGMKQVWKTDRGITSRMSSHEAERRRWCTQVRSLIQSSVDAIRFLQSCSHMVCVWWSTLLRAKVETILGKSDSSFYSTGQHLC